MNVRARDHRADRTTENWRGVRAWIYERIHRRAGGQARLAVVEKICFAPRQTLSLIEVDGERILVGTSQDGSPQFYPLRASSRSRTKNRCTEIPVEGTIA
jgi:flagellar biogenesis protein FliO